MVFNDLVVEVSKDALVVVDQPEEASGNVAKLTLANGETRGDLHAPEDLQACSSWCQR